MDASFFFSFLPHLILHELICILLFPATHRSVSSDDSVSIHTVDKNKNLVGIRAKLLNFISRRPTQEDLYKRGIIKGTLACIFHIYPWLVQTQFDFKMYLFLHCFFFTIRYNKHKLILKPLLVFKG